MRIDAHQHYWRYRAEEFPWIGAGMQDLARDFLPAEAAALMDAQGIAAAIAVQARPLDRETDWLLSLADAHPRIAGVVGSADLSSPSLDRQLERWRAHPAFVGVRPMLQDLPDPGGTMANAAFNRGIEALQSQGKVFELLLTSAQLHLAQPFCARHDRHWLVLDHAGKPRIRDGEWDSWLRELHALAALPHVACKLSGLVTEAGGKLGEVPRYARAVLDAFGPERTLFGSDWPVCTLAADYAHTVSLADAAATACSPSERAAIFGGNAIAIYGLRTTAAETAASVH